MKVLPDDRLALIDALVAETELGGVTAALLEKDEHLTDALRALFELPLDGLHLVFCDGSSLSKAHGLIERMSEDADLKVVLSGALEVIERDRQTQAEYTENLLPLVYGNVKPSFAESFASFESIAKQLLASLPESGMDDVHH